MNNEKKAIYAGSFDPFTNGHLAIVEVASKLFDKVYVCIAKNPNKNRKIDVRVMAIAISKALSENNIEASMCKEHSESGFLNEIIQIINKEVH